MQMQTHTDTCRAGKREAKAKEASWPLKGDEGRGKGGERERVFSESCLSLSHKHIQTHTLAHTHTHASTHARTLTHSLTHSLSGSRPKSEEGD